MESESDGKRHLAGPFRALLWNSGVTITAATFAWFSAAFWVFLETRSVMLTSVSGGVYFLLTSLAGLAAGPIIDRNRKKKVMVAATTLSGALFAASWFVLRDGGVNGPDKPAFWLFLGLLLAGSVVAGTRTIVLPTLVTLLVPRERREHANGLVGTVNGVAYVVTTIAAGMVVGTLGMTSAGLIAAIATFASAGHLLLIRLAEPAGAGAVEGQAGETAVAARAEAVDRSANIEALGVTDPEALRVTDPETLPVVPGLMVPEAPRTTPSLTAWAALRSVPSLLALILFTTINNLLDGVFVALSDPYGLLLMSVELWGVVSGILGTGYMIGGLLIARFGLGCSPVRTLFAFNVAIWSWAILFPLHSSVVTLALGFLGNFIMMPFVEASEQAVIQRVVPYQVQGRVFGLAQAIEKAAVPMSAFLVGPIAEYLVIPSLSTGTLASSIGPWFGTGAVRALALVSILAGSIGLAATLLAMSSRAARDLEAAYRAARG